MKSLLMSLLTIALAVNAIVAPSHSHAAELLVGGFQSDNVLRYDSVTGAFLGVFGQADASSGLNGPNGLAFGPDGNLYVASRFTDSVLKYDGETGAFLGVVSGSELTAPNGLVFGPDGNLYVAGSIGTKAVLRYDGQTGAFLGVFASPANASPQFGPDGNLYVLDADSNIRKFHGQTGEPLGIFIPQPVPGVPMVGFTFGPDGNIYFVVSDPPQGPVLRFNGQTGAFIDTFVAGGVSDLTNDPGIVFGPDGHLYLAVHTFSTGAGHVLRYDGASGTLLGVAASGPELVTPSYLTFRPIPELVILIDIKPGSDPNSINPRSRGVIPVAILTTESFDASAVDPTTVRFGRTGTEAAPVQFALEDVNADGDADLILHFNTQGTGIVCGDTSASLTGETFGGQAIKGSDSISTVGCK